MGFAKDQWLKEQARGWKSNDKFVCDKCVEDSFLKNIILNNLSSNQCDYCSRIGNGKDIAAPFDDVMEVIAEAFYQYYANPTAAGVPRDDGEWVDEERFVYTGDALSDLPLECDQNFFDDVVNAFDNVMWIPCAHGSWLTLHPHEELLLSWNSFVETVTHQSRFFFIRKKKKKESRWEQNYSPWELLKKIEAFLNNLGLVKVLDKGTLFYRVRMVGFDSIPDPVLYETVGPPPQELASAGRMNPAGISYFYLALEKETALAEIIKRPPCDLLIATFKNEVDLYVLDLTELPNFPSVFDEEKYSLYQVLLFMDKFSNEIAKPVIKDGREHVEYVPSQIVSEFISQEFKTTSNGIISGIIYPSAVHTGGKNIVLFPLGRSKETYFKKWESFLPLQKAVEKIRFNNWEDLTRVLSPLI